MGANGKAIMRQSLDWLGGASKCKGETEERSHRVCLTASTLFLGTITNHYSSTPEGSGGKRSGLWQSSPSPGSGPFVSSHLSTGALRVERGPPSLTVNFGEEARLICENNGKNPNITWWFSLQSNNSWPPVSLGSGSGPTGELIFSEVNKSHRGLYWCQVTENKESERSCGTYLRVRSE